MNIHMSKSTLFITRAVALIIGLALWHALKLVGYPAPEWLSELGAAGALVWLGLGDLVFASEHKEQKK